jgi:protein-L-isoaspartate(D-aspartate) O-methyltransferase
MTDFSGRRVMMVDTQVRPSDVTKFPIIAAMLAVPRESYVPQALREAAYMGGNLEIAPGRVLIEARTLAKMLEALNIQPQDRVLSVACGIGYSVAVLAELCGDVTGLERDADMAKAGEAQLAASAVAGVRIVAGGISAVAGEQFDVIVIEGGVEDLGADVAALLREGGRVAVLFMQGALGTVKIGTSQDGQIVWRFAFNASAPVLAEFAATRTFTL